MAGTKELKKRIGTVKNTQQTTRAMKLVSAAKLRKSQDAILTKRPYAKTLDRLIRLVSSMSDVPFESPLLGNAQNPHGKLSKTGQAIGHCLVVVVTSDRGLCGGFNATIIKTASKWIEENRNRFEKLSLAFIGRRGSEYFGRRGHRATFYEEFGRGVSFQQARDLSKKIVDDFVAGKYTSVKFIYNEFKNAISQIPVVEDFLPLHGETLQAVRDQKTQIAEADLYLVKPDIKTVLEDLLKKDFAIQVYRILLESQASEHGARMSSMDNATRNAGEMIRKLTLQFNKSRQAAITKELLEIISGSESQKTA